jgi:raffinose/stachyose/melibiose transport system permease protein
MFGRVTLAQRIVYQIVATILVIPFLFPLVAIVAISFSGQGPLANYGAVLTQTPFLQFLFNSAVISAGTIVLIYVVTMLAGFAFAKLKFKGRKLLFNAILVGLVLPSIALMVPMFIIVRQLGLFNNYLSVILPLSAVTVPLTLLLARNYLNGIPDEVIEAAKIDGATSFGTLVRIVLPLSRPITAVIVVWAFLQAWNEFFLPLLFLQDPKLQVVTQVPQFFTSTYGSDVSKIFAALVLICLPIVITYLLLQKFFEKGLTAGAVK